MEMLVFPSRADFQILLDARNTSVSPTESSGL